MRFFSCLLLFPHFDRTISRSADNHVALGDFKHSDAVLVASERQLVAPRKNKNKKQKITCQSNYCLLNALEGGLADTAARGRRCGQGCRNRRSRIARLGHLGGGGLGSSSSGRLFVDRGRLGLDPKLDAVVLLCTEDRLGRVWIRPRHGERLGRVLQIPELDLAVGAGRDNERLRVRSGRCGGVGHRSQDRTNRRLGPGDSVRRDHQFRRLHILTPKINKRI